MKTPEKKIGADDDTMRPEYDFRQGVRGKHAAKYASGTNVASKLQELAEKYSREGYEVTDRPPFLLGGFQPDLVVRKGVQGFVFQLKSSAALMPVERLQKVAAEISRHDG